MVLCFDILIVKAQFIRSLKTKNDSKKCEHQGHKLLTSSQYHTLENYVKTCDHLDLFEINSGIKKYPLVHKSSLNQQKENEQLAFEGNFKNYDK